MGAVETNKLELTLRVGTNLGKWELANRNNPVGTNQYAVQTNQYGGNKLLGINWCSGKQTSWNSPLDWAHVRKQGKCEPAN